MDINHKLEELALSLYHIDAVKFGDFVTKSGIKTPVYFDLRVIVSYPGVMELISLLLYDNAIKDSKFDHVCGVPYTALPIATLLSVKTKKSMLMRRKETKSYGTKKSIEGHYKQGETCLIIEDVITSGSSVMETVTDLKKEGLKVEEAVIILDREQGGKTNLEANNIQIKSLFTMTELINILVKNNKISKQMGSDVINYLKNVQAPVTIAETDRTLLPYEKRAELTSNQIAKQLFTIMATKKTNLCLSVDLTLSTKILDLLQKVGEHVCLVKTHIDIIEDYTDNFIVQLKQLAQKFNFLLLEDRKYADIGHTVSLQYSKGQSYNTRLYRSNSKNGGQIP
ncbi:uridine 5'-monophosphate synthase isoform X2 [Pararge aegeria]|uniref:uridine 5'-monophosphate synthase isoform X2 n=1 Tax=Pararge aegeria TaxID=116150 RepID=UPI0019D2CFB8|nr:uridine 5'-monophosphate synthase isoform X2 [Pararge aegeria]